MKKITWTKDLELGIESIDKQHQHLISIANRIYDNFDKENNSKNIGEIVHELLSYSKEHFKHEEEIFQQINYKDQQDHIKEHESFIQQVDNLVKTFVKGRLYKVDNKMIEFITEWVYHHISETDRLYVDDFSNNQIK